MRAPRFTPTGVGTTWAQIEPVITEHGSPPRAWGQLIGCCRFCRRRTVHPHGRGDNVILVLTRHTLRRFTPTGVGTTLSLCGRRGLPGGSPPRAWGQLSCSDSACGAYGSPPRAWGQLSVKEILAEKRPVHPHGRGDNAGAAGLGVGVRGSPPRAWGQLVGRCPFVWRWPVHPHGRGDNVRVVRFGGFSRRFTPTGVGTTW